MKDKYFKVELSNDNIKKFDIICKYPLFSAEVKEAITNRTIFKKCSDLLCLVNCGLTYEGELIPVEEKEALMIIKEIISNETTLEEYKGYLDEIDQISTEIYEENIRKNKAEKRKSRKRVKKEI